MVDDGEVTPTSAAPISKSDYGQSPQLARIQIFQSVAGLAFVFASVISFVAAIYQVMKQKSVELPANFEGNMIVRLMTEYPGPVILIAASFVGAFLGRQLLSRALQVSAKTISDDDRRLLEPIIAAADDKAISQYVRISSLSGNTGLFTKLGFTGMPLVTATLGMALVLLAMLPSAHGPELMDLAKLVIGAFIGSFVQKKAGQSAGDLPEDRL